MNNTCYISENAAKVLHFVKSGQIFLPFLAFHVPLHDLNQKRAT